MFAEKKIHRHGNTRCITISNEEMEYLNKKVGDTIKIMIVKEED